MTNQRNSCCIFD